MKDEIKYSAFIDKRLHEVVVLTKVALLKKKEWQTDETIVCSR